MIFEMKAMVMQASSSRKCESVLFHGVDRRQVFIRLMVPEEAVLSSLLST